MFKILRLLFLNILIFKILLIIVTVTIVMPKIKKVSIFDLFEFLNTVATFFKNPNYELNL